MIKHGMALLLLLFVMPTQVCVADEINILTPEHGIRVNDQTVWLVALTTPEPIDMVALLKNKGTVKKIKGKVLKKDEAFAFHALLSLETGLNEVTVRGKSLSIFYRPRYRLVDKSTGKEKVFQDYPRYFFHTPKKEARCSQCHAMDRIRAQPKPDCSQCHGELTSVKYLHGPLGGGVCFVCHDPDSAPSSFAPRFDGGRELCFGCHDEAKKNFEKIQRKETYFHCAVRDFPCTTCHNPHGSPFQFQLPVEEKRMCYLCHEEKEIAGGKFVHQVLESEGCVACHDSHTSNYKGHLADAEQALCSQAECHPQFAKITEGHPIQTHPVTGMFGPERRLSCSGCHDPHSSDFPFLLPGEKHSFCAKCHDDMRFLLDSDRALSW
jgi:predicted CXXCH cytochrome family protein